MTRRIGKIAETRSRGIVIGGWWPCHVGAALDHDGPSTATEENSMQTVILNNGVAMPLLGFGVYQISDENECESSVSEALRVGYRSIDTAAAYGNEEAVGRAIRRSDLSREDLFITTKLWIQDAGHDSARRAFERSLQRLQLDYLDLYLIHQPFGDVHGAWRAMEALYREGRVRAIGISNFQPDRVVDLVIHNQIVPAVNQIETHPFFQQAETAEFLRGHGIQIESWGPFAEGRNGLFENDLLRGLAKAHGKTVAQVVLRWLLQREVVTIPKSVRPQCIAENFDIFDFELTPEDMHMIATLDTGTSAFLDHRDPETVKWLSEVRYEI